MAGLIAQSTLDQIRTASDIVEVIGGCFPLKRAGANFTALCPFHKEKTPSFSVNPTKQIFYCFGCHQGGDVFKFLQQYENINFLDAVKRLADRAGIVLEFEQSPEYEKRRAVKDALLEMHSGIAHRWHTALLNDAVAEPARDYLKRRGVTEEAVKLFQLGYAPDDWADTVNWARGRKYDLNLAEQGGLVISKEDGGRPYGRFRGRLMFPICDEQGRVIGFSGRVLDPEAKGAKYVNSPETPLFQKGRVIYGLDKSRRAMLDEKSALICEGQLDLIACHMAGIRHVAAPQGTALTSDQARVLKRYADEVVLCFDSDTAGQAAAVRSLDALLEAGLAVRVMTVPAPHDPDSFIQEQGADAFRKRLTGAESFFDFHLRRLCETHGTDTDAGRRAVLREMGEALRKADDAVLADRCAQQTALALRVSAEAVRTEFAKAATGKPAPVEPATPAPVAPVAKPTPLEYWLVRLLFLAEDEQVRALATELELEWIGHSLVREVVGRRMEAAAQGDWRGVPALLSELDEAAAQLLTRAMAARQDVPAPSTQLADLVNRLRDQFQEKQLAHLTRELARTDLTDEEEERLLREHESLRRRRMEAANAA